MAQIIFELRDFFVYVIGAASSFFSFVFNNSFDDWLDSILASVSDALSGIPSLLETLATAIIELLFDIIKAVLPFSDRPIIYVVISSAIGLIFVFKLLDLVNFFS